MRVGGSHEIPYVLHGPLPAGNYHLTVEAYQRNYDAILHAEILYRPGGPDAGSGVDGGPFQTILSADGTPPLPDAGSFVYLEANANQAAIEAACGDTLMVRVQAVSGTADLLSVVPTLEIP